MDYQSASRAEQSWHSPNIASSQLFTVGTIVNPLVAAASPLLTLASELRHLKNAPDKDKLHKLLCHEIRAFELLATSHNYSSQVILAARYLLCALIDEILLQSDWGNKMNWSQQKLLSTVIQDRLPDDMFFLIIEKSSLEPDRYLDIIELCYFCLNHGFKGKYIQRVDANDHLNQLMNKLYDIISQQRGEFSRQTVINCEPLKQIRRRSKLWRLPPVVTAAIISAGVLITAFFTYNHRLNQAALPLTHVLNRLQQPNYGG